MKNFILTVCAAILMAGLSSCGNHAETSFLPVTPVDLANSDTLVLAETSSGEYLLSYPEAMFWTNGDLVVQDRLGHSRLFHTINSNDSTAEFASQGNGPGEYLDANLNPFVTEKKEIGFYDPSKRKILYYEKKDGTYKSGREIELTCRNEMVREAIDCGKCFLVTGEHGTFAKHRFLVADSTGLTVAQCGNYPSIDKSLLPHSKEDMRTLLFSSSFWRTSPDKQKAVFATYHGALFQLFDLSQLPDSIREIKSLLLSPPINHSQITADHEGWVYGFEDVFVSDHFVYLVYNGQTALDNPEFGHHILVYDWNGEMIKAYATHKSIRSLAVDEVQRKFYLAGYDFEEGMKLYTASMDI